MLQRWLSLFVLILLSACSPEPPKQALGTLERDRITYTATANEIIRALPIKEGQPVSQGQVLVQLDTKNQRSVLAHASAEQAKAEAYLLKLSNGERPEDIAAASARVAQAQAQLVEANKRYQRNAELVKRELISQAELDSALAQRDSARAGLNSAQEQFNKLTAGSRPEDIEQAKAALMAAQADVALQQQKLAELTVTATRDGILDSLPYNLGERAPSNAIIAVIQANRVPYARVYVPANYRVDFVPGAQFKVHVDGLSQSFQGTVRWVASEPSFTPYYALTDKERARLMYLAEVDLPDSAATLPSGIPAQVDLQVSNDD
ncbi:HlyD family secretion protein [Agarivorans gilvus]|uniref:Membrane protein n=1 Tax=Agarivorans gilvus TaxID=680279 RepID=A0ABQ1I4L4_9ALTE|nr:HlyD family efflux transporter periplasmic adaptor subunit [Agarivorans gilvus]GGB14671.1 membrane protein [Agarivorans gilvus]